MNHIDLQLYRPLKAGKEFEKLIPPYKGTDYSFDKEKDNSDTFDSLRFMAQWAQKYAEQMSKVAPKLKGGNLQETVKNIYNFLYHHFQYRIDEELQNLYSPSAAWHFREKGFDCKTYSILASTILQNLQIPHAFRMVQQAGMAPDRWSHVYVIVLNGNNHYVIDATTHSNKEVSFTKKYDYIMKHRGLASPHVQFNGLGCACQGQPISQSGLGSPAVLSNTIKNFHSFLNLLEKQGISRQVTDRMLELVKINVNNGIDPNLSEIITKAFQSTGNAGLNSPVFYGSSAYAPTGLGTSLLDTGISLASKGGSGGGGLKVGGVDVAKTAANLATGNYVGAAMDVIKAVVPIDKTIGNVFKNGFDLSCWGASYSEGEAQEELKGLLPFIATWSNVYAAPTTENLDKFLWLVQGCINDSIHGQLSKYAKCTRNGYKKRQQGLEAFRTNVLADFTAQSFQLIPAGQKTGATWKTGIPTRKNYSDWANNKVKWDSFNVVAPNQTAEQATAQTGSTTKPAAVASQVTTVDATGVQTTTVTNTDGSKAVTKTDVNGNTATVTTPAPAKSSNIGTILTIGSAVALAAKFLL